MKFIERLAQWISEFFYDYYDEEFEDRLREVKSFHRDNGLKLSDDDFERWEKELSKKPKTAEEKAMKKKKVVTKKKTEGKAATKAKPARDANGRFVKQS